MIRPSFSIRLWLAVGAFYGMLAVILSALTSHLPAAYFVNDGREMTRVADTILAIQSLALMIVSILQKFYQCSIHLNIVAIAFMIGTLFFCVGVFYIACTGNHPPLPIAPIGGSILIGGWFYLTITAFLLKTNVTM
ncbi:DUF423 domain-containing protein [Commensalibacter oyaizuii]|uniref:DUF423 domain-containing protein n=1 Tax=Commensalibacter oyaizuii TaxID=3043873 RepID=A0ABT6PZK4_9PROT|nr:DUF423 domain-containing protein [Commensalibacter sp. TBRC 16381]MDI2089936.1 DUF423 domain-containing protein [Commensalibacter sp. TBRC 16381]